MAGYFQLSANERGGFSFNLKAGNHEVILTSQVYTDRAGAQGGIDSVRTNAPLPKRFDRRKAKDGSPYFVLLAANGQIIGRSEMYSGLVAMESGIKSVMGNGVSTVVKGLD